MTGGFLSNLPSANSRIGLDGNLWRNEAYIKIEGEGRLCRVGTRGGGFLTYQLMRRYPRLPMKLPESFDFRIGLLSKDSITRRKSFNYQFLDSQNLYGNAFKI